MTLLEALDQAQHSLFCFEFLQFFSVNSEKELWRIWETEHRIADEYMQPWWDYISEKKNKGIQMQRVSLIRQPLSPYKEMEMEIFKKTVHSGDEIRIIESTKFDSLNLSVKDFWLIDTNTVVILNYDSQGEWLGFETTDQTSEYLKSKQLLLKHSDLLEP